MVNDQETENQIKKQRQKQAILYAIQNDEEINRTKLMKYVFFVDLFAYNKFKDTILEDEYIRLPNGPVPRFGFDYTTPNSFPGNNGKDFTMHRVSEENGRYYYYKFELAEGIKPNLTLFSPVEQDLLELTLKMIQTHSARYLSEYTHGLSLWKDHEASKIIKTQEFSLHHDEMEDLESLLHTKIYVDAVNPKHGFQGFLDKHNSPGKKPKRLPELFDVKTGKVL